ncbi:MAG TPA: hypothetical protein VLK84_23410 [Longimicrobium sp.]|nr:hypothetical protein [Longimicrobium sp.]
MKLNLDELNVDSFSAEADQYNQPVIIYTVLYETEQVSCGGSCGSCPCWA